MAYFNGEKMENYILKGVDGRDVCFKKFAGTKTDFNAEGVRSFTILLTEEEAEELQKKGWRIKMLENKKEPGSPLVPSIRVRVSFGVVPPKIYMVTSRKKQLLDESTIMLLDTAEITKLDILLTPYVSKMSADGYASAYVKTAYFNIVDDDPFEDDYAEID